LGVHINSVDCSDNNLALAVRDVKVPVFLLPGMEVVSQMAAGSKTVKTNIDDPKRPGVSLVRITNSKYLVAMGNLLRVYSFDI